MSCSDPRKIFYIGINPETGKKKTFYTSRYVDYIWRRDPGDSWHTERLQESQTETHGIRNPALYKDKLAQLKALGCEIITNHDLVPCGQCIACRLNYARQWSARIMLECARYPSQECWFVTFTFNDTWIPPARLYEASIPWKKRKDGTWKERKVWLCKRYNPDPDTGELVRQAFPSVSKRLHTLLMKRIRDYYPGVRFFCCWEYGSKSFRCHAHYIFFGLPRPKDLRVYKRNYRGDVLYTSDDFVQKVWSDKDTGEPYGYVIFGSVTSDSASYVARYTMKKRKATPKEDYERLGIDPEFCLMSRRPGIGSDYINENWRDVYGIDKIVYPGYTGAIVQQPPTYFDTVLERISPDIYEYIKESRRNRRDEHLQLLAMVDPDLDLDDLYENTQRKMENTVIAKKDSEL